MGMADRSFTTFLTYGAREQAVPVDCTQSGPCASAKIKLESFMPTAPNDCDDCDDDYAVVQNAIDSIHDDTVDLGMGLNQQKSSAMCFTEGRAAY